MWRTGLAEAPRTRSPGPDVVLWSGNLHASSPESCLGALTKLRALLPPAGMLLIHDYLLDDTHTGPLIPVLVALHLTLAGMGRKLRSYWEGSKNVQLQALQIHATPEGTRFLVLSLVKVLPHREMDH